MPGDWTLDLEKPTCGLDGSDCPYFFPRCNTCPKKQESSKKKE